MKCVIVGAGPAGLTAGLLLAQKKQKVIILEQDGQVGGIAKTVVYKRYRFDLGGHRFFAKFPEVTRFWHKILGKDLISVHRSSKIFYQGKFFNYPLEPGNALKNLGIWGAFLAFDSHLLSGLRPIEPVKTLEDVYINSFGRYLYQKFFQTYSMRLWGISPNQMAPDWGYQRVGKLSLFAAIKDAFLPHPNRVKSLIKKFHYPRLGPGQMWEKVSSEFKKEGGRLYLNTKVDKIFHNGEKITAIQTKNGQTTNKMAIDQLISSMPIRDLVNSLIPRPEKEVLEASSQLKYRDFILVALVINKKNIFPDQWIYIQDPGYTCLRVQNINNWSSAMVEDKSKTVLGVEYTTVEGDPLWQWKDKQLIALAKKETVKLGFARLHQIIDAKVVRQKKAYPVYDLGYQKWLEVVKRYLKRFTNLNLIGRNGMHKYNNMDHSMMTALFAVKKILGQGDYDQWSVNTDTEYHEDFSK